MSSDSSVRQTTVPKPGERPAGSRVDTDLAKLGLHIRALVDDLMRDVLDAVAKASTAEIGELIGSLDRGRPKNGAPWADAPEAIFDTAAINGTSAPHSAARSKREGVAESPVGRDRGLGTPVRVASPRPAGAGWMADRKSERREDKGRRPKAPLAHGPFDITSPGELLASTSVLSYPQARAVETPKAEPSQPTMLVQPVAAPAPSAPGPPQPTTVSAENVVALSPPDSEAASERRPKVVLREGERLLSATGSGVVIRRERRR